MNKTKLVLLTAATLLAITSGAEAARVKRAKPSFSRPAPTQVQRAPAPVTNPVPGRPVVAQPATKPATQTAPAQNAAPSRMRHLLRMLRPPIRSPRRLLTRLPRNSNKTLAVVSSLT